MKISRRMIFLLTLLLGQLAWVGCVDNDPVFQNYYTFTGETVASYLTNRDTTYSEFIEILKRAKMFEQLSKKTANMYDQLTTYGEYTCFALPNNVIDSMLMERNRLSVAELTDKECDTIAKTHLVESLCYTTDLEESALPNTNFMDQYLLFSTKADTVKGKVNVAYYINNSRMINRDDSVANGVVHTLNKVLTTSTSYLPELMAEDTTISYFVQMLKATGLDLEMKKYIDENYTIGADSTVLGSAIVKWSDGPRDASYPERRKFGYTAFVEPNALYRYRGGKSAQDIMNKLVGKDLNNNPISHGNFAIHDPFGRYTYDHNYKDPNNVVYRFVAYHLLDRLGNYNQWNVSSEIRNNCAVYDLLDPQDFFETMCPGAIMKFQTTREGRLYINRRRVNEGANADPDAVDPYVAAVPGVRVYSTLEMSKVNQLAINGIYHYIDNLLIYNSETADALNTRIRIDASTLSPDFLNNPGRHRSKPNGDRGIVTRYKPGFVTNFSFSELTLIGVRNDPNWSPSYQRDGLDFLGQYDFTVKLPPVPEGQYEIRLGINASNDRGIVQVYLDDEPCGIPIDMRVYKSDPKIGALDDDPEDVEFNERNDKDLRNRGYMKGPDSWKTANLDDVSQRTLRAFSNSMRIILATRNLHEGEVHYLRFKSVVDNTKGIFPFDYMEFCPKSVYGNPEGEDTH